MKNSIHSMEIDPEKHKEWFDRRADRPQVPQFGALAH
jgi:hypothetical protein